MTSSVPSYAGRAALLVAFAAAAYLVWLLRLELLVVFAAGVFGIALYTLARALGRRTGWSHRICVVLWYLLGVLFASGLVVFANQRLSSEYGELSERIPASLETLERRLEGWPVLGTLGAQVGEIRESLSENGEQRPDESAEEQAANQDTQMKLIRVSMRTLSLVVVWAVLSLWVALDGRRYYQGALTLVPGEHRHVAEELGRELYRALPMWLVGRLASMTVVAALTAPGLLLLGVPLPWLLAIVAGLFSFVPFLGPIASVVPAALIALEAVPQKVIWVFVLFGAIQFLESNFITPRIQQRVASIPALVLITGQVVMGVLVGTVGVMFSTPLALTALICIQIVYVRHYLGRAVTTP
jgi:predicted PurR-regulated permease PerM